MYPDLGPFQSAIAKNESRLRQALVAGRLGYWRLDLTSGHLETSDVCRENFRRDPKAFFSYEDLLSAIHPDDRARIEFATVVAAEARENFDLQYRVLGSDGSIGWVLLRGHAEVEDGRTASLVGITMDITETKALAEALLLSETTVRLATESADIGIWDLDLRSDTLTWSDRTKKMFGISPAVACTMRDFYAGLHPDDRDVVKEAFSRAIDPHVRAAYDVEYRTLGKEDGIERWVAAKGRGIFDEGGRCIRAIGTAIDISKRKRNEVELALIARELNHRMRNLLAMVQAIANQTLRANRAPAEARVDLEQRIAAMAKAQDILSQTTWDGADMTDVVEAALSTAPRQKFSVEGPAVALSPKRVLAMSLALHELVTNATKYGALKTAAGRIMIRWSVVLPGETFRFEWIEAGGPKVTTPAKAGFGSKLLQQSLSGYFGGEVAVAYPADGVQLSLIAPAAGMESDQEAP